MASELMASQTIMNVGMVRRRLQLGYEESLECAIEAYMVALRMYEDSFNGGEDLSFTVVEIPKLRIADALLRSLEFPTAPSLPNHRLVKKVQKPKPDARYAEFVEILSKGYKGNKWHFGFGGPDGKQLKELLKLRKDWKVEDFIAALKNYFQSEGVVPGALPRTYLVRLPNYHAGPLNKYGKLVESDKPCAATENMR